jgi:gluconate 2-dehydrogenase gamma chain
MTSIDRRRAVKLLGTLGAAPLVGGFDWSAQEVEEAAIAVQKQVARSTSSAAPGFFTPQEWETVRLLVDMIIPRDARSGSATEAGVPEFMDFMMVDGTEARRVAMREGLAWLDEEARRRSATTSFLEASDTQRRAVLDDIAWPARARPEMQLGVGWFNSFRDLTGAGFFSSRMGHEDLQYMGNQVLATWNGCPDTQLRKLGVTYDVMNTRR